ncbi:MAG: GNAT family N-acetyltransferase [Oscillospiraceae bacterium]|nr:GNAT family N-acetyltransferase [Oscillospiraceae bacterium]
MDSAVLLRTERTTIRHIAADDWRPIKDIWVDFNASKYARYDMPHITEDANVQVRIAKWAAANSGTDHMFFAVCCEEVVIGYIAFNRREDGYEIGYCFHSAYHGKGYAKESHLALFDHMRTLGITKFYAGTAIDNGPSVKLLTSLGFRLVGREKVSFYKDEMGNDIVFEGGIFEMEYPDYTIIPYDEKCGTI